MLEFMYIYVNMYVCLYIFVYVCLYTYIALYVGIVNIFYLLYLGLLLPDGEISLMRETRNLLFALYPELHDQRHRLTEL